MKQNIIQFIKKTTTGKVIRREPSKYLIDYLDAQGVTLTSTIKEGEIDAPVASNPVQQPLPNQTVMMNQTMAQRPVQPMPQTPINPVQQNVVQPINQNQE